MPARFLTNREDSLGYIVHEILEKAEIDELCILTGYFYFSGLTRLKISSDKKMRILVGMEAEIGIGEMIKEYAAVPEEEEDRRSGGAEKTRKAFYRIQLNLFGRTSILDTREARAELDLYIEKLKNGTLEVRKTEVPNHSKLYLFGDAKSIRGMGAGILLIGSSNLTSKGFQRDESNLATRDEYEKAREYFDELWESSDVLIDRDSFEEFRENVLDRIWVDQHPNPYLIYLRVLDEYFEWNTNRFLLPAGLTNDRYTNLSYQSDAVRDAVKCIGTYGGVILADVVGLGKSVVASSVAANMELPIVVIAPPHLLEMWQEYGNIFKLNITAVSSGQLQKGREQVYQSREERLIIVDEAHKFRNETTATYTELHQICQGNKVMLLSATPFNNRPADVFALLKLFQTPSNCNLPTVEKNLHDDFQKLISRYNILTKGRVNLDDIREDIEDIGREIRRLIHPVVIRRTRIDLQKIDRYREDLQNNGIIFPKIVGPEEMNWPLGTMAGKYKTTLEMFYSGGFTGARYNPLAWMDNLEDYFPGLDMKQKEQEIRTERLGGENLVFLMNRLLVARFESSIESFRRSLRNFIAAHKDILDWVGDSSEKYYPSKDYEAASGSFLDQLDDDELDDIELDRRISEGERIYKKKDFRLADFKKAIESDIAFLKALLSLWENVAPSGDPKLVSLNRQLEKSLKNDPKRKIIVFSQYRDTAEYLYENLEGELKSKTLLHHGGIKTREQRRTIRVNFDASHHPQENKYRLLITTDAISEGYNLNRAGRIINYDIPYNPVRVIQRVGRINRIGSNLFNELYINNYFPSDIGEDEIRIKGITTIKNAIMTVLFGNDTKSLTQADELVSHYEQAVKEKLREEEESWEVEHINTIDALRRNDRNGHLRAARALPLRVRVRRKEGNAEPGGLLYLKEEGESVFWYSKYSTMDMHGKSVAQPISPERALSLFKANAAEKALGETDRFELLFKSLRFAALGREKARSYFGSKIHTNPNSKRRETVNVLSLLRQNAAVDEETGRYLHRLLGMIKSGDLPLGVCSRIIAANKSRRSGADYDSMIQTLKREIPGEYLLRTLGRNTGREKRRTLIVAEEFCQ